MEFINLKNSSLLLRLKKNPSITELRLLAIATAFASHDESGSLSSFFTETEYRKLLNSVSHGLSITIRNALVSLSELTFICGDENDIKTESKVFRKVEYLRGSIRVIFTSECEELIQGLSAVYRRNLKDFVRVKKTYSFRLYEACLLMLCELRERQVKEGEVNWFVPLADMELILRNFDFSKIDQNIVLRFFDEYLKEYPDYSEIERIASLHGLRRYSRTPAFKANILMPSVKEIEDRTRILIKANNADRDSNGKVTKLRMDLNDRDSLAMVMEKEIKERNNEKMGKVIAFVNQKGGVGKTTAAVSISAGLSMAGKKVLLIDWDAQGSASVSLGIVMPDEEPYTVVDAIHQIIDEESVDYAALIRHHEEELSETEKISFDFVPCNITLSGLEVKFKTVTDYVDIRTLLRKFVAPLKDKYDYILIDCPPTLGSIVNNGLAAADEVFVPVKPDYLSSRGLIQLVETIQRAKRHDLNPNLKIGGILFTLVQANSNFNKSTIEGVEENFGMEFPVFKTHIPHSVRAAESTAYGNSIFWYEPDGKVAEAYKALVKEILENEQA